MRRQRYDGRWAVTPPTLRSAISNGSKLLDGLNQNSAPARRYRDIQFAIAGDLGGIDHLSEGQLQLARTAAGLVVMREALDVKVLSGDKVDASEYTRISNTLRRVLVSLGLRRVPRDVLDLQTYLRRKARGNDVIDAEVDAEA